MHKLSLENILILAAVVASLVIAIIAIQYHSPYAKLLSGSHTLTCEFSDGQRTVDASQVQYEINGYWKFYNGGASNCKLSSN